MQLEQILKSKFHFTSFKMGQKEIIEDVMAGQDVIAMLPTGAGKSICYQLPAYLFQGAVLIVSPLVSLMEDQVQQLKARGEKKVVGLNSFLSYKRRMKVLRNLQQYRFIYASPEILQSYEVMRILQTVPIRLFVIDEAHCISQWGHEFRTDYLKLRDVREKLSNPPCLALTATATNEVLNDIISQLHLDHAVKHIYPIDRPNIAIYVQKVDSLHEKIEATLNYVKRLQGPGIIYFSSRMWTEKMTAILREKGMEQVAYYHGGMENEDRLLIQQQFIRNQLQVICCTNAFGMGIDKPNIRYIIHFHYPSQFESYMQEIGRAGRDGKKSIAILLYENRDHSLLQSMIKLDLPNSKEWELLFTLIHRAKQRQTANILEETLISIYGISEVKWRYMKYQLEQHEVLIHGQIYENHLTEHVKIKMQQAVKERLRIKTSHFMDFKKWILEDKNCRRKTLLQTFQQTVETLPEACCDICGISLNPYMKTAPDTTSDLFPHWEDELKLIFKQMKDAAR